jgi:hypothetical protein
LVVRLPRDYYNPGDEHLGRPAVVVKVDVPGRGCVVVTRTTQREWISGRDVYHDIDVSVGCDRVGWWQPWRPARVTFAAFEDPDVTWYQRLDDKTFDKILKKYEERS